VVATLLDYDVNSFLEDAAQYPKFNTDLLYNGDDLLLDVKAPVNGTVSFVHEVKRGNKKPDLL